MSTVLTENAVPPPEVRLKRFTVAEYERMVDDGRIAEDSRVELLDGWIVEKMPHNAPHDSAITRLMMALMKVLSRPWILRVQSSATLDRSVPEPDLAVLPGPAGRYDRRRPSPGDLALVVEVAESSLIQDRGLKQRLYARNRVPVYWIVNLQDDVIEVFTHPRNGKKSNYQTHEVFRPGESVPVTLNGKLIGKIAVSDILPR